MTSSVSATNTNYDAAMETIRSEVEEYCNANGIDSDDFLANLDGNLTASIFDNPSLLTYFQMAAKQLLEILYPEVINSLEGEVSNWEDLSWEELCAHLDDDVEDVLTQVLEDDPELMVYFATTEAGAAEGSAAADYLAAMYADQASTDSGSDSDSEYSADDAREVLPEDMQWIANYDEMWYASEMGILNYISDLDQSIPDLYEALNSGEIDETVFQSEMENLSFARETMMTMLQQVTNQKMQFFEMISEIYSKATEMDQAIISNMRSY